MKLAITAASGQLGQEVVKTIKTMSSDDEVIGLARTPEKAKNSGIEVRPGDYNNREMLEKSLQGVDVLLLISGMDLPSKRIAQHRNVIEAAKNKGIKKIVYTSIQGAEQGNDFSPIVKSNRQTEEDIINSGLDWVIGRNGLYIEPDIEYIQTYKKQGSIRNCAYNGKTGYTTRAELAYAYAKLIKESNHNSKIYNLNGESITQYKLADFLSKTYGIDLSYKPISFELFKKERIAELGEFKGSIIAGIYQTINQGKLDNKSDYLEATGRHHIKWENYFNNLLV